MGYECTSNTSKTSKKGDEAFAKAKSGIKQSELNEQLKEYIGEWRNQREKEEEELKRLKDKQAKRKEIRADQDKKLAQQKKEEEERVRKEEAERKAKEAEEKKKRLEEAEQKRQAMMEAQKEGGGKKRSQAPVIDARREMSKTKEQLEEEKKISLGIRIKPLNLEEMDTDQLKSKANQLWDTISTLETDKYDYEQRQVMQDYELRELKERQKMQLRNKAIKKGLDPEALTGKHPPKIRMYSKYERRTDTRTYGDRKKLYEGG